MAHNNHDHENDDEFVAHLEQCKACYDMFIIQAQTILGERNN